MMRHLCEQQVINRKLELCPRLQGMQPEWLIKACRLCGCFFQFCCVCNGPGNNTHWPEDPPKPCHHFQIVFTDGSCRNNGRANATAGIGIAYGLGRHSQMSLSITDEEDNFPRRSSQRAELYAAQQGLAYLAAAERNHHCDCWDAEIEHYQNWHGRPVTQAEDNYQCWIVASDSEYVVKGITEWLPTWKVSDVCWKECSSVVCTGTSDLILCSGKRLAHPSGESTCKSRPLSRSR